MPYIHCVPWVSMEEWKDVKKKFSSSDCQDWVRAYQLMLMWKMRCQKLPANVECSLGIIHVLIQKSALETANLNVGQVFYSNENDLRLSYSTAIVRFVNHIMIPTKSSFYTAASEQDIPDWIVSLRHDISHSAELPSVSQLESAVAVAKQWLIDNYWTPQEVEMIPVDGRLLFDEKMEKTTPFIETAVENALNCWLICRKKTKENRRRASIDFSPAELQSLMDLKKLFESSPQLKEVKRFIRLMHSFTAKMHFPKKKKSIRLLLSSLDKFLVSIAKKKNVTGIIVQSMFNAGVLRSGGKDLELWAPILIILHETDSLEVFLEKLFEKLAKGSDGEQRCANEWLLMLLPSLESVQKRWKAHRLGNPINGCDDAYFQLSIRKPPRIRFEIFREALVNLDPISGSSEVASRYAKFLRPKMGKDARSSMTSLVQLYTSSCFSNTDSIDLENFSVHSVDDLITEPINTPANDQVVPEIVQDSIWTLVDIDVEEWHKCPIGLLPHQKEPNLQMPDLVWVEVAPESRKRKPADEVFEWDE